MAEITQPAQDTSSDRDDFQEDYHNSSENAKCNLIVNYLPQEVDDNSLVTLFEGIDLVFYDLILIFSSLFDFVIII